MPFRGDRLRQSREKKNLTQRELAQLCGFTEFQVSNYERSKHEPHGATLEAIVRVLEVSADYLLGFSDEPHGIITVGDLNKDEQNLLTEFRRNGWKGVVRLGVEQWPES